VTHGAEHAAGATGSLDEGHTGRRRPGCQGLGGREARQTRADHDHLGLGG
jgi:hypothetical protein